MTHHFIMPNTAFFLLHTAQASHCLLQAVRQWDARRLPPERGEPSKTKAKGGFRNESLAPLALEDFSIGQQLQKVAPGFDDVILKYRPVNATRDKVHCILYPYCGTPRSSFQPYYSPSLPTVIIGQGVGGRKEVAVSSPPSRA